MNKLTALIEAAKAATPGRWKVGKKRVSLMSKKPMYSVEGPSCVSDWEDWGFTKESAAFIALANPATILELCALLEKAEEALLSEDAQTMNGLRCAISVEAIAAIKQWKEQT